jgi:hypothetical protein
MSRDSYPRSTFLPPARREAVYQKRMEGLQRALAEAVAKENQPAIERLEGLIAALSNCMLTGRIFRGA